MRESLVEVGTHDGKLVSLRGHVREQVGHFQAGLPVALERPPGAQQRPLEKLAVLEVFVAKAVGRQLPVQLVQQRLGVERIHVARAALHEEVDHSLGCRRQRRWTRCQRGLP